MATYVLKNTEQLGPFTDQELAEELRNGNLSDDDLAWKAGMEDWKPLRELFGQTIDRADHVSSSQKTSGRSRVGFWVGSIVGSGIFVIAAIVLIVAYIKFRSGFAPDISPADSAISAIETTELRDESTGKSDSRIGETKKQIQQRYGAPTEKGTPKNLKHEMLLYRRGDFLIAVEFKNDRAILVSYLKTGDPRARSGQELSDAEIETLLEANRGGSAWLSVEVLGLQKGWRREDGYAFCAYDRISHRLEFATREFTDDADEQDRQNLKGF
jgi:uncharacterized protein DUF4339